MARGARYSWGYRPHSPVHVRGAAAYRDAVPQPSDYWLWILQADESGTG